MVISVGECLLGTSAMRCCAVFLWETVSAISKTCSSHFWIVSEWPTIRELARLLINERLLVLIPKKCVLFGIYQDEYETGRIQSP